MSLSAIYYIRAADVDRLAVLAQQAADAGDEPVGGPIFAAGELVQCFVTGTLASQGGATIDLTAITADSATISGPVTAGSVSAASGNVTGQDFRSLSETLSKMIWVDVDVDAATLDGAGTVEVRAADGNTYRVREIILHGGGTNFGAGGDRTIVLTDGTTVFTTVPNANIETAPTASRRWGSTEVPFSTDASAQTTDPSAALRFEYAGGTTDHTTGSISFAVCLQQITPQE